MDFDYTRYLEAKRSVDERALNRSVWESFVEKIARFPGQDILKVLEIGAGTGSTFFKIIEHLEYAHVSYTLLDNNQEHLRLARHKLVASYGAEWQREFPGSDIGAACKVYIDKNEWDVTFLLADLLAYVHHDEVRNEQAGYDVIIGQAVLDLFDLREVLPSLKSLLNQPGLMYFPITFDGVSAFLPSHDRELDRRVETIYHASMMGEVSSGSEDKSITGRRLVQELMQLGMNVTDVGGSDWFVKPGPDGSYPDDEGYFLECILHFFYNELSASSRISVDQTSKWLEARMRDLECGKLMYLAHQLDVLAGQ